ncbi:unnamed protein product, partial [Sphacelaria rigidula]
PPSPLPPVALPLCFLSRLAPLSMMTDNIDEVVNRCIEKLLAVMSMRPGTEVALPAADITLVVQQAREVFLAQPMLLEV